MKVNKTDQQAVKEYFDSASEKHQRGNILNSELMTKKISRKERYKFIENAFEKWEINGISL